VELCNPLKKNNKNLWCGCCLLYLSVALFYSDLGLFNTLTQIVIIVNYNDEENDMLKILKFISAAVLCVNCAFANATPITFLGADDNVSSLSGMVNSTAALSNFLAVTGALNVADFESPLPSNLTVTGGTTVNGSSCGALCGFNTTAGGSFHREVFGGSVTFSFTAHVDAFGFFVNGLQTDLVPQQTIVYVDGSSATQTVNFPSSTGGGGAFVGFVDYGQMISSVTFNATNDILGFDDLRFGRSATNPNDPQSVPEPSTLAIFALGMIGLASRRFKKYS
jgi:hypothetical protein